MTRTGSVRGLLWLIAPMAAGIAAAQDVRPPRLYANETLIEDVTRRTEFDIDDPVAVFAFVLGALPDRVRVYPTENYYYFSFFLNGSRYSGNIRLPAAERDKGKIRFEYYQDLSAWADQGRAHHTILDASRSVAVERIAPLVYRVSHGAKSVTFALEDLSGVQPAANAVGPNEEFIGPIIDESGVRFFLLYNSKLKVFHYILDERFPADELLELKRADRLLIGRRTGFAFYRDHRLDRLILIGAHAGNSRFNTYFDGPFDQLPENTVDGDKLRRAIIDSDRAVEGEIDRFVNFVDGSGRYLIHPYSLYRTRADLSNVHSCAIRNIRSTAYYKCFAQNDDGRGGLKGHPVQDVKGRHAAATKSGAKSGSAYHRQHRRHVRQRRPL
ncbi:MAG: hypothetical protein AB7F41_14925 [Methylocystis sp.]|uniref:hypothetical protein n=1 Tax=Methylocystis sp. TaxID=1911079 RepID=UPI003D139E77